MSSGRSHIWCLKTEMPIFFFTIPWEVTPSKMICASQTKLVPRQGFPQNVQIRSMHRAYQRRSDVGVYRDGRPKATCEANGRQPSATSRNVGGVSGQISGATWGVRAMLSSCIFVTTRRRDREARLLASKTKLIPRLSMASWQVGWVVEVANLGRLSGESALRVSCCFSESP
jgi:hypothetical protein